MCVQPGTHCPILSSERLWCYEFIHWNIVQVWYGTTDCPGKAEGCSVQESEMILSGSSAGLINQLISQKPTHFHLQWNLSTLTSNENRPGSLARCVHATQLPIAPSPQLGSVQPYILGSVNMRGLSEDTVAGTSKRTVRKGGRAINWPGSCQMRFFRGSGVWNGN